MKFLLLPLRLYVIIKCNILEPIYLNKNLSQKKNYYLFILIFQFLIFLQISNFLIYFLFFNVRYTYCQLLVTSEKYLKNIIHLIY